MSSTWLDSSKAKARHYGWWKEKKRKERKEKKTEEKRREEKNREGKKRKRAPLSRRTVNLSTMFMHSVKCLKCRTATPGCVSGFICHRRRQQQRWHRRRFSLAPLLLLLFLRPLVFLLGSLPSPPASELASVSFVSLSSSLSLSFLLLTLLSLSPLNSSSLRPMKTRLVVMSVQTKLVCCDSTFHQWSFIRFFACPWNIRKLTMTFLFYYSFFLFFSPVFLGVSWATAVLSFGASWRTKMCKVWMCSRTFLDFGSFRRSELWTGLFQVERDLAMKLVAIFKMELQNYCTWLKQWIKTAD